MPGKLDEFADLNQESPKQESSNQEPPILDLANDCFQFVTGYFEVISVSVPHIYHSALLLSPKTSIVRRLYESQVNPLARVVQGVPNSWDHCIANTRYPSNIRAITWSPCSRFIAISWDNSCDVVILDAVTLKPLHTMHPEHQWIAWDNLVFSPDSHLLAGYSYSHECIVSWDLQTGGLISSISTSGTRRCNSMSYSGYGTMLGGLFDQGTIITYNISSGKQISLHSVQGFIASTIWTDHEFLQYAIVEPGTITIWEVSFTPSDPPTQINSLKTPDNFSTEGLVFLSTHFLLAFISQGRVIVWDAQHKVVLLDFMEAKDPRNMSFSLDGNFFVCGTKGPEFYLWKKSSGDYLHQKFTPSAGSTNPLISPNGELIISFGGPTLQLWHTTSSLTSPPGITTQPSQRTNDFLLEFSPNELLVAVTQRLGNTVTILDLKSGNPQMVIDADILICGIGITENKIVVVGDKKIITWELPAGDCIPDVHKNIDNSVQATEYKCPAPIKQLSASISPGFNYIAFGSTKNLPELYIYDLHTGKKLAVAKSEGRLPGFTLNGNEVWCARGDGMVDRWAIVGDSESNNTQLGQLGNYEEPQSGFPWHSSHGYQVMDDEWVLNSGGKRLLWLPPQWRSAVKVDRKWSGKYLALLHRRLLDAIILELEV